jgi:hypothetical protein
MGAPPASVNLTLTFVIGTPEAIADPADVGKNKHQREQ